VKRRTPKAPELHAVDVHVGGRLRLRRVLLGMTQHEFGAAIAVTFQQVQKYETGVNRVAASTLWQIARVLDVPVSFFFDDAASMPERGLPPARIALVDDSDLLRRESLDLMRAWYGIPDIAVRRRLFAVIKECAAPAG
jgi:transcriptional regulator with XRE-family HTH domain